MNTDAAADGAAAVDGAPALVVEVDDRQSACAVDTSRLAELLRAALDTGGVHGPAEVGLAFIDIDEMTELNNAHMHVDGPTDVLAFPIDGSAPAPPGQPAMVGDIVICPEVAGRSSQPLADELALLVVHGALHLLGHDHAEAGERAVMRSLERRILDAHWKSR